MKGKRGRPNIPFANLSARKSSGLTGAPDTDPNAHSSDSDTPQLARGGASKKRLDKRARGGGIHIKPSHKGLLHKDTKTPAGEPISESKLEKAKNSKSPAVRKRAVFAENAKHWNKK